MVDFDIFSHIPNPKHQISGCQVSGVRKEKQRIWNLNTETFNTAIGNPKSKI